jgi:thiopeptide-type bacteriocin biosynthesis protein
LYEPLDWILIRAPLLPISAYPTSETGGVDLTRADVDGPLRAALTVGSRDLLAALDRSPASGRDAARVQRKLLRYLIRMSARPTPYGLFAGVALARWGRRTDAALAAAAPVTRTRPDMEWLWALVGTLEAIPEVRRRLRLIANPAVIVRAGRVFASEPPGAGTGGAPASPVSIRATGAVKRALELARQPIPYRRLHEELLTFAAATAEKVEQLVDELLRHNVLTTDLRPPLTCCSPAAYVVSRLDDIPAAAATRRGLAELLSALTDWDQLAPERRAPAWPHLVERVTSIHPLPASASPVQLDSALVLDGDRVHEAVGDEAAAAAELLLRLSPYPRGLPQLNSYRQAFEARYGHAREVPLLELLDAQFGLGPPVHGHGGGGGMDAQRAARRHQTLRDLALDAYRDQRHVVELDDELLARLETWTPALEEAPLSLDVSAFVAAESATALDAGDFQLVVGPNLGAGAGGRNLGRFAGLLGDEAADGLGRLADAEADLAPDCVFAEIVYAPQRPRLANVVVRAPIRRYEITLGATPGVSWERVVPLWEMVVGVRDGRFYVRWPRIDSDIVAVQGHMLNPMGAPPTVRFLLDATADAQVQLSSFDWGPAAGFPFLPRVQRGRIVLSLAQWRIDPRVDTPDLAASSPTSFAERISAWRARRFVPRAVYLAAGDNRLLLDLEEPSHLELLRDELRAVPDGATMLLEEGLPGRADAWLRGPGGGHMSELVIPVVRRREPRRTRPEVLVARRRAAHVPTNSRLCPPGGEWLYLKLYHPAMIAEELISGPLRSFAEFALAAGLAEAWFFIRYADPDPHLRVRFHGDPDTLLGPLLKAVSRWATDLMADGTCVRFSFDVYEREVERYGGPDAIRVAESIFAADSTAVPQMLELSRAELSTIDRETLAIVSIDDLLASVGLGEDQRLAWYRENASLSRADGQQYRQRQALLRRLLGSSGALAAEPGGRALERILRSRGESLAGVPGQLDALEQRDALEQPISALCASHVHLHCNRLLGGEAAIELRVLQLLRRTREGLARAPLDRERPSG